MSLKQIIIIRTDLKMGVGKMISQATHASLVAYHKASRETREAWERAGAKKVILKAGSKQELMDIFIVAKKTLPAVLIRDAGLTQLAAGEETAVGIGPAEEEQINKITGKLKLI